MNKTTAPHTPEPWTQSLCWPRQLILDKIGMITVADCERCDGTGEVREANTARIISCVNACAGMADPAATIAALRGALELGLEWSDDGSLDSDRSAAELDFRDAARSALALCARDGKGSCR